MKNKNYLAVPVWVAAPLLGALITWGWRVDTSISDLKASVAGLQGKMELIISGKTRTQLAQHE